MSERRVVEHGGVQASSSSSSSNTTVCKYYLNGACRFGQSCFYSHDTRSGGGGLPSSDNNNDSNVPICKYFLSGHCMYGSRCFYKHKQPTTSTTNNQDSVVKRITNKSKLNTTDSVLFRSDDTESSSNKYTSPASYFEALTGKKMTNPSLLDSIDLDEINMFDQTYGDYLRLKANLSPTTAAASVSQLILPLCPYYEKQLECPFGETGCELVHGWTCEYCQMPCLHPNDPEQRATHQAECMRVMEREMEEAFAVQRSKEKQCGVCMEVVWDKEPASGRRFGILENCAHVYCLDCIRKWRASKSCQNKIVKACPECRVKSDYVTPSLYWFEDDESKKKIIDEYKNKLSKTHCKYFKQGDGVCPFGNKCFYLHRYKDGTLATDLPDPTRRRRLNRYGELEPYSNWISVGIRLDDQYTDDDDDDYDDDTDIDPESAAEIISFIRHHMLNRSDQSDFFYDEHDFESNDDDDDDYSWYP